MTETSTAEDAILKAIRDYAASEYQRGEADTIARIMGAAKAAANGSGHAAVAPPKDKDRQRATKGAAKEYVKGLLTRNGALAYGALAKITKNEGVISVWTLRKELQRGNADNRYSMRRGKWHLRPIAEES